MDWIEEVASLRPQPHNREPVSEPTEVGVARHQGGFVLDGEGGGKSVDVIKLVGVFDLRGSERPLSGCIFERDGKRADTHHCSMSLILAPIA